MANEELLAKIQNQFARLARKDAQLMKLSRRIRDGTDYETANEYAVRVGELLSKVLTENMAGAAAISEETARAVLTPMLALDHSMISEIVGTIQQNMNKTLNVGLKPQIPALDTNRIEGLVKKVSSYESANEAMWVLEEPVVNYSQAIVDQSVRDNARLYAKAGGKPKIIRKAEKAGTVTHQKIVRSRKGKAYKYMVQYEVPCEWCAALAGVYDYEEVRNAGNNVYRRHKFCRCTVTFADGNFRQNVWKHTETWTEEQKKEQIKKVSKAEQRRIEKEAQQAKRREIETKLRGMGFEYVSPDVLDKADINTLTPVVDKLNSLEERFNVIKRSTKPWMFYDTRHNAIAYVERSQFDAADQNLFICGKYFKKGNNLAEVTKEMIDIKHFMPADTNSMYDMQTYTVTHEYGHMIHNLKHSQAVKTGYRGSFNEYVRRLDDEIVNIAKTIDPNVDINSELSAYGKENEREFFAEVFANSQCGNPNTLGKAMIKWLERNAP